MKNKKIIKYSPTWLVSHVSDAPSVQLELIKKIRSGIKKSEWKMLIESIGATEKEFEHILPSSISSMQKKSVYDKATSERIYEISRLFGFGFDVFDTKEDFKGWLMQPLKTLGNKRPIDLLDSSIGFELVEKEILRIHYNIYS